MPNGRPNWRTLIKLKTIYLGAIQFWLINILLILVLFAFPEITLILPNMQ